MGATFRGTKAELLERLRSIPARMRGMQTDDSKAQGRRLANAFLRKAQQAFLAKSAGQRGDDGEVWPALTEDTKRKRLRRGLKNWRKEAERQWESWSERVLAAQIIGKFGMSREEAVDRARAMLVPILHDTGRLFDAFMPGSGSEPSGASGQSVETEDGSVTIGIRSAGTDEGDKYKHLHHYGIPASNVPARPFWNRLGLTSIWWQELHTAFSEGMEDVLRELLE